MPTTRTTFKALRTEQGFTSARKLARRCDVSPMAVLGWDGGSVPAGDSLLRVAEVLNTSPAYILRVISQSKNGRKPAPRRTPTEAA